jgi:hypothetical protein
VVNLSINIWQGVEIFEFICLIRFETRSAVALRRYLDASCSQAVTVYSAGLHARVIDRADEILLSFIEGIFNGNAHFPEFREADWKSSSRRCRNGMLNANGYRDSHQLNRILILPNNDPFLICAEQWHLFIVPDRLTIFEAR